MSVKFNHNSQSIQHLKDFQLQQFGDLILNYQQTFICLVEKLTNLKTAFSTMQKVCDLENNQFPNVMKLSLM